MVFPACTLLMIDIEQELHVWMVHLPGQLEPIDTTIRGEFFPIHQSSTGIFHHDAGVVCATASGVDESHFHRAIRRRSSHRLEWNQHSGEEESASI